MNDRSITVATWNVEWATPGTRRGRRVAQRLSEFGAEVLVVTEGCTGILPAGGHVIDAGDDWGYGRQEQRRKVLAWSRWPWSGVESIRDGAGRGRAVWGQTESPIGVLSVVAVCIPWADAHVRTGRSDTGKWHEHLEMCEQLGSLSRFDRAILAGDFNQRIPRSRQPHRVAAALDRVLEGWTTWTSGETEHGRLIDHIATTGDLSATDVTTWPTADDQGALSDHVAVACRVR